MTLLPELRALLADINQKAAAATADPLGPARQGLLTNRAFFCNLVANNWPTVAAAIDDLAAQVEEMALEVFAAETVRRFFAEGRDHSSLVEHILEVEAERDALAARLDAAEKVCRAVDSEDFDDAWRAWRELAP